MEKHLRTPSSYTVSAAAILAGGVLFTGPASAAVLLSENFEGVNVFGMGTYAYSSNYTMPNNLTPGGGLLYGNGGAGIPNQVSQNTFPTSGPLRLSLTSGTGLSTAQIDARVATYDFRAQFSTFRLQGDFAALLLTFTDGNGPVGNPITLELGGSDFTAALASGQFGNYPDARAWGESGIQGIIPAGARTLDVLFVAVKTAEGTAIDGYVDNISLVVVPEPTSLALMGCAALGWLRRRRR